MEFRLWYHEQLDELRKERLRRLLARVQEYEPKTASKATSTFLKRHPPFSGQHELLNHLVCPLDTAARSTSSAEYLDGQGSILPPEYVPRELLNMWICASCSSVHRHIVSVTITYGSSCVLPNIAERRQASSILLAMGLFRRLKRALLDCTGRKAMLGTLRTMGKLCIFLPESA